ncbi:MAG TPA: TolC family protein [Thermoanaerobaculia bacterium]|nr:TolC family protein [Thermoanaerobaculia bacterium]
MIRIQRRLRSKPPAIGAGGACGASLIAALATGALLLPALPASGEVVRLEPMPIEELEPAGLEVREDGIQLSLDQAVEIALRRNLGLVIERYNWIQTREGVLQSLGIYDTLFSTSAQLDDETSPTVAAVEGVPITATKSEFYRLGLSQLTPLGGLAELAATGFTQETNSQNVFRNPLYSTRTDLSYSQPLLRGFGRLPTERRIMVARVAAAQSTELFEQRLAEAVNSVELAYWNLVEARNQLVVAQESLGLAQVLHDQNQVRVDVGTLAPLELISSEAGIANREEDIIRAEATIGDAEDQLRLLLHLDQGELWDRPIVPVTDPETPRVELDLEDSIRTALSQRPEIASQIYRIDALEIDSRFFRNQALPQLDLRLNYGLGGLSGTGPEVVDPETGEVLIPATQGGYSDAFEQVLDRDFDRYQVQVLFSYPLQNRDRRAQRVISDLALEQGLVELEQLQQQIVTEVRAAARRVETAAKQIDSAGISRRLEERNLEAERKRYENGMSSSFRVLEIQEDLTQARSREVSAVTTYRRALSDFYRSIGRLLEQKGVELEGAVPDWKRHGGWSSLAFWRE